MSAPGRRVWTLPEGQVSAELPRRLKLTQWIDAFADMPHLGVRPSAYFVRRTFVVPGFTVAIFGFDC